MDKSTIMDAPDKHNGQHCGIVLVHVPSGV